MKKFLLASTITMLSFAAFAEPVRVQRVPNTQYSETQAQPAVYQKQTVVRYNVPTCKNCQTTTTVSRVVNGAEPAPALVPCPTGACNNTCTTCGAVAPVPVQKRSCVFDNHKYASPIISGISKSSRLTFSSDCSSASQKEYVVFVSLGFPCLSISVM